MGLQTGIAARPQVVSLLHKEQPSVELYIVLTDNTIYLQMPQILYKDVLACEIQEQSHGGQALARGFAHQNAHLEVDITAREADELERATQWPLPARCGQALITRERQSFFTLMQYPNAGLIAMRPHLRGLITKRHSYLRRKVELQVLKLNVLTILQLSAPQAAHIRKGRNASAPPSWFFGIPQTGLGQATRLKSDQLLWKHRLSVQCHPMPTEQRLDTWPEPSVPVLNNRATHVAAAMLT